jgi:hypothetical protein
MWLMKESPKPKGCPLLMVRVAVVALLLIWLVIA